MDNHSEKWDAQYQEKEVEEKAGEKKMRKERNKNRKKGSDPVDG